MDLPGSVSRFRCQELCVMLYVQWESLDRVQQTARTEILQAVLSFQWRRANSMEQSPTSRNPAALTAVVFLSHHAELQCTVQSAKQNVLRFVRQRNKAEEPHKHHVTEPLNADRRARSMEATS